MERIVLGFLVLAVLFCVAKFAAGAYARYKSACEEIFETQLSLVKGYGSPPGVVELHAAIDRILSSRGHDVEAVMLLLHFGIRLKPRELYECQDFGEPLADISGVTPEFGMVHLKKDSGKDPERINGLPRHRIGRYLVWRSLSMIFLNAYEPAQEPKPYNPFEEYTGHAILFLPTNLEYLGFGGVGFIGRPSWLPGLKVVDVFVHVISGKLRGTIVCFERFRY